MALKSLDIFHLLRRILWCNCAEIDTDELEKLTQVLETMGNDVTLLRKWYRKDNNKVMRWDRKDNIKVRNCTKKDNNKVRKRGQDGQQSGEEVVQENNNKVRKGDRKDNNKVWK